MATVVIPVMLATSSAWGAEGVSPEGDRFPLALYSIQSVEEMKGAKRYGWNVAHTYGFKPAFLQTCDEGGMLALASLPGKPGGPTVLCSLPVIPQRIVMPLKKRSLSSDCRIRIKE